MDIESGEEIKGLLRLHDEECLYFGEMESHGVAVEHCDEFMERLTSFYRLWPGCEEGVTLPVKQVFSTPGLAGDFRVMPCVIDSMELKFVKIIGTNEEQRRIKDKICVGKAMLIDYHDNHVYALFDVCALSSFRTAAIAVLAMRASGVRPEGLGLVGTGRIGFYTACILHKWLGCRDFAVFDPEGRSNTRFRQLCAHYLPRVRLEQLPLAELLAESRAVFLATTATAPLLNAANAGHLRFISSVGADADNLSELDASLLVGHRLITDAMQSMNLGDMKRWRRQGLMGQVPVTELRHYMTEKEGDDDKILFISTGVAIQDALICKFIYEKRQEKGGDFLFCREF